MDIKICAAGLCLAVIAAAALAVAPVEAQTSQRQVYTTRSNPPVNRPLIRCVTQPEMCIVPAEHVAGNDEQLIANR